MLPVIFILASNSTYPALVYADSKAGIAKPLSSAVKHGLDYLIEQQQDNGGWSQGTESANMGSSLDSIGKVANVGDTCMAGLALIQAGSFPDKGEYSKNLAKAAEFVCGKVEKSDDSSLSVTDLQGTRIQMKLGPNIDTFLASLFLTKVKGHMPNKPQQTRVAQALDKVIAKMEKNQGSDGRLASGGWAPVHAQALATKALNLAKQGGTRVSDQALARAQTFAEHTYNGKSGAFATEGAASVPLYAAGSTLSSLQDSINTGRLLAVDAKKTLALKGAPEKDREEAKSRLDRLESAERAQSNAIGAVTARLADSRFVQGFGCNGGEEFLSYLDISETLKENDPKQWHEWDHKITENLERIQNQDGSWMGQHCITSKTFVTAAAILVLTVDRETTTAADKIRRHA